MEVEVEGEGDTEEDGAKGNQTVLIKTHNGDPCLNDQSCEAAGFT